MTEELSRAGRFLENLNLIVGYVEKDLLIAEGQNIEQKLVKSSLEMLRVVKETLALKKDLKKQVTLFEVFINSTKVQTDGTNPREKIRQRDIPYFENNISTFFCTTALQNGALNVKQLREKGVLKQETMERIISLLTKMCNQADSGLDEADVKRLNEITAEQKKG